MLVFKKVELSDIEKIRPFIINEKSISCDNSIGGIFLWRDYFDMRYCIYGDTLYLMARGYDKRTVFATPIGPDFDAAVNNIRCFSKEHGISTVFSFVSEDLLPRYEGFSYSKESFRDWFDYVYDKNEFVSLRGRKYNGQRNHINRFSRSYPDHCFEKITAENISDVILFYKSYKKTSCAANEMILEDENKTFELLLNYEKYRLLGGLIRVEGKVAAFSVGEVINDVLFVHVEKADTAYSGIYPVMANTFASAYANENVKYINREDDAGEEGLRTAKLSYHPKLILPKYQLTLKE